MEGKNLSSLFGWSSIASNTPPKIATFNHLFTVPNQEKQELALCIDGSGSTLFDQTRSHDNKSFSEIYAEALLVLTNQIPNHKVICWSSTAKYLVGDELQQYESAIQNRVPIAQIISGMNGGTDPQHILPLIKNRTSILVTDGDITDQAIAAMRNKIPASGIGSVFLIIVPHIDQYKNMYNDNKNVEVSTKDSIRLSIPQAFSERLATVIIWNYRKKVFELIPELTAPWVDQTKSLFDLLDNPVPVMAPGEFLTKCGNQYKSFSLPNLIDWFKNNNVDEDTIEKLVEMDITSAIRQQASAQQRDAWNLCIQNTYNKILNQKMKSDFVEIPVPENATMIDRIKITTQNDRAYKKLEATHSQKLGVICAKLSIGQTVSEMKNVGAAKSKQTIANVAAFSTMKQEDKLAEISSALPQGDCSICGEHTHVFKTVSVPAKLLLQFSLCQYEKQVQRKKNQMQTIKILDLEALKVALETYSPKLYFMDLCTGCTNTALTKAKLPSDPENCVTGLVPQNQIIDAQGHKVITERLFVCPFIRGDLILDSCDPNDSRLSFARQTLRGFISKAINLDPAGQDCLTASLMFLSAMANNKESAQLIFPNQKSLLSGGKNNKYPDSVGRLFKPTTGKISAQTLSMIAIVENVIELAEIPVLPESTKLLLLCLLERKVTILITAQKQRTIVYRKLTTVLDEIRTNGDSKEKEKFGISAFMLEGIQKSTNNKVYGDENKQLFDTFIATYFQNVMGWNVQSIADNEKHLLQTLNATNVKEVATALNLNEDYLQKMIERSKMTSVDFMHLIPAFVNALVNHSGDKTDVMMKFI